MYVGQTRSTRLIGRLQSLGWGEMTQPDEYPPRRLPWVLDNAAFKLWRAGLPFDGERFRRVAALAATEPRPDFVVCPDVVAGGMASLALSLQWAPELAAIGHRLALVVQDGMRPGDVAPHVAAFGVLFIGGTRAWKLRTARAWSEFAHRHDMECHLGRAGAMDAIRVAREADIDSGDSCLPLFSEDNLQRAIRALSEPIAMAPALGLAVDSDSFTSRPRDAAGAIAPRFLSVRATQLGLFQ